MLSQILEPLVKSMNTLIDDLLDSNGTKIYMANIRIDVALHQHVLNNDQLNWWITITLYIEVYNSQC